MKTLKVVSLMLVAASVQAASPQTFYVYSDKGAKGNHYIPSGWMGDYGDMKLDEGWRENCADGVSCIKIAYDATKKSQGANWAGMYWQHPANNWGKREGGYDLKAFKRLVFWARGEKGGERIATFKVGGIAGDPFTDSGSAEIGPIELTNDWKRYTIPLDNVDMSKIMGGFCWSASGDDNPKGVTFYLDEVRYE